jgi:ATP-dependent RNA helicase RhlE
VIYYFASELIVLLQDFFTQRLSVRNYRASDYVCSAVQLAKSQSRKRINKLKADYILFMTFEDLGLIEPILKAVKEEGYEVPTPIQEQAIPIVMNGFDLLGCAQTGTGKTAAFAMPILHLLEGREPLVIKGKKAIRALIVTPTRELAIQIGESFETYGRHTNSICRTVFGGVSMGVQTRMLKNGADILVATPGRLLDLLHQNFISLKHIELFVLDEADRMLDMGFIHDIRRILAVLPKERQSLFFSATMPPPIMRLADGILNEPKKVQVTPVASTAELISQTVYFVDKSNKPALLRHLIEELKMESALVFARTKYGADRIAKELNRRGIKAEAIHGNKAQNARQKALTNFKTHVTKVLVATDIAARGIDIDELQYVFNYELPNIPETYVHRIGRTGRAGANGCAISFCDMDEKPFLRDIQKLINKVVPVVDNHPYPMAIQIPLEIKEEKPREIASHQHRTAFKPGERRGGGRFRR